MITLVEYVVRTMTHSPQYSMYVHTSETIYICVCVSSGLRNRMVWPDYEVVRIGTWVLQPGLQPWTVASPALDSGQPMLILWDRRDKEACQWQETNDKNTTEDERRTDKRSTNELTEWDFQLPQCETRDLVLLNITPWELTITR